MTTIEHLQNHINNYEIIEDDTAEDSITFIWPITGLKQIVKLGREVFVRVMRPQVE